MSKFKGSGDITRAMILGMLSDGQKHGYEIKKRIRESLGQSADINFGSIYYGLKSLTEAGLVDHIRDEPGKGSPERSIYRITPRGRRQLALLIEQCLRDRSIPLHPVEAGLYFMDCLPGEKALEILSERYETLLAEYENALDGEAESDGLLSARLREYRLYLLGAEVHWLKNFLQAHGR